MGGRGAGDWNAHDICWDEFIESDDRGRLLIEWADGCGLNVLNDGSATRFDRGSSRRWVPDVTFVYVFLRNNCTWCVEVGFTSDHVPIELEVGERNSQVRLAVKRMMWDWKNADWDGFREFLSRVADIFLWECMRLKD
mgnify:FL=1